MLRTSRALALATLSFMISPVAAGSWCIPSSADPWTVTVVPLGALPGWNDLYVEVRDGATNPGQTVDVRNGAIQVSLADCGRQESSCVCLDPLACLGPRLLFCGDYTVGGPCLPPGGVWLYEETNGLAGLQRGGTGALGTIFPPLPIISSCVLLCVIGTDPITDYSCGYGPDHLVTGGYVRVLDLDWLADMPVWTG